MSRVRFHRYPRHGRYATLRVGKHIFVRFFSPWGKTPRFSVHNTSLSLGFRIRPVEFYIRKTQRPF